MKMAARGVFLLINLEGGVRVFWGGGSRKKTKTLKESRAVRFNNMC